MASVTEPIWLTFNSRQLQAFSSTARSIRLGLVTVRSSPTIWIPTLAVNLDQAAQSSWSKGSSMETTVGRTVRGTLRQARTPGLESLHGQIRSPGQLSLLPSEISLP